MIAQIAKAGTPAAQYIGEYADEEFLWDELAAAAWLDPSIITNELQLYMDIDTAHSSLARAGNVLHASIRTVKTGQRSQATSIDCLPFRTRLKSCHR
jgi:inosine-uridine nucleoside N-ribohydrolase